MKDINPVTWYVFMSIANIILKYFVQYLNLTLMYLMSSVDLVVAMDNMVANLRSRRFVTFE